MKLRHLFAFLACILTTSANAQSILAGQNGSGIYFYDFVPDTTIFGIHNQNAGTVNIDINGDNIIDFLVQSCNCSGNGGGIPNSSIVPLNNNEISFSHTDSCHTFSSNIFMGVQQMAFPHPFNDTIDAQKQWISSAARLNYNRWGVLFDSTGGHPYSCSDSTFLFNTSSYVGVRIFVSTDTVYGWIKLKKVTNARITVEEYGGINLVNGIKENSNKSSYLIYPNPSSNSFNIEISSFDKNPIGFAIFDLLGRKLLEKELSGGFSKIDVSNLPSGTYFARFQSEKHSETKTIVIK